MRLFTRRYRSDPVSAGPARARIVAFAAGCGFDPDALIELESAAGEAIAHAIGHGNATIGRFTVTCSFVRDTLSVEVWDRGNGFGPSELPTTEFSTTALRAWGIFLMRAFVDRLVFADNGSRVRLEKRLPRPDAASVI